MQLIVLGLNHKTAPVEVREKFNFSRSRIKHVLRLLKESDDFSEAVLLSTCNRTELYLVAQEPEDGMEALHNAVKRIAHLARISGTTSFMFNTIFNQAISSGKKIRTRTQIAYRSVSVSSAAVDLAIEVVGDLSDADILVIGAGKMRCGYPGHRGRQDERTHRPASDGQRRPFHFCHQPQLRSRKGTGRQIQRFRHPFR